MIAIGRGFTLLAGIALALDASAVPGKAETRLNVHYTISMTRVSIGQLNWTIDVNDAAAGAYRASANGKASGPLSIFLNGEGHVTVQGTFVHAGPENGGEWRLAPSFFSSDLTDDGEFSGVQLTFDNGTVTKLHRDAPPPKDGRIPISDADMRGVSDPLSAMLLVAQDGGSELTAKDCNRVLAIFDGQRRYDLALSFKRIDGIKIARGYSGPALVCAVVVHPIAGHRADSLLVKYVSGRHDMEIWFAPMAGTALAAPVRLVMPTAVGTLEIAADRFQATETNTNAGKP